LEISEAAFDKMFDLNVKSVFFMVKEAKYLLMKSKSDPNILFISSASSVKGLPRVGVYAMTKAAMNNMTEWLATELMEDNIRVNCIAPGLIPTKMSGPIVELVNARPEINKKVLGKTDDIGALAATICSEECIFINGESILIHGGFLAKI
jgi:dehydrogenase/reductase SDR family protein 4